MNERINLIVDSGTRSRLTKLAGSERKMGEYISDLVQAEFLRKKVEPIELLNSIDELGLEINHLQLRVSALAALLVPRGTVFADDDSRVARMISSKCLVCGRDDALIEVGDPDEYLDTVCTRCDVTYPGERRK